MYSRSELLTAITNCHGTRVGERHNVVCVYSLTDPLIPATPPVSLLCPNLSGGLTGPGWQMGSRGQPSVGSMERLRPEVLLNPFSIHPGSCLTWPALTPRMERPHTTRKPRYTVHMHTSTHGFTSVGAHGNTRRDKTDQHPAADWFVS